MIARLATRLARNPAPEHRWRRVAVPVSAAAFMLLVLAATSIVVMAQREAGRVQQRTAMLAKKPSPTDLILAARDDVWRSEQYLVVWIEPASIATPVLPPGMKRLPEPGQAVVSPALDRLAARNPDLAGRYPDHLVLGSEGVRSGDELFAYVRVPEGRTLPGDLAGDLSGETRAVRVRAFGSPTVTDPVFPLEPPLPVASVGEVVEGALGLLVVPGLIVLTIGTATASGVRDSRFEVLRWIGAPERTLIALGVLETLILAVPGLGAVMVLWGVIAPRLERVPLVGHTVLRGDLKLPWWLLVAELVACAVATSLVTFAVTAVRSRRKTTRTRPGSRRVVLTPLRASPLVIALVAFVLGRSTGENVAANLNIAGVITTVAGVPLLLPCVLRATGAALARLGSVPALLAGRGLEWDPVRAARPFAGGAALLILTLVGSGYIALARDIEAISLPAGETQTVFVEWLDPRPEDPARLADASGAEVVVPLGQDRSVHEDGHTHEGGDTLVAGATCRQLAPYIGAECRPGAPFELSAETERRLAQTLSAAAHGPGAEVQLAPAEEVANAGSVCVLDDTSLEALDQRVRVAAMRTLPAPYIHSALSWVTYESPLVAWIVGGLVVAVIALAIGCLLSLVDRLLATRGYRRHLLNLGLVPRRLTRLEAWLFAVTYGATVAVSFPAGVAICALMVGFSNVPMPWRAVSVTLGITVVAGLLGTASVVLFGARNVREYRE